MYLIITKNKLHKRLLRKSLYVVSTNVFVGNITIREKDFIVQELQKISLNFQILEFYSNFNNLKIGIEKENFIKKVVDLCFEL